MANDSAAVDNERAILSWTDGWLVRLQWWRYTEYLKVHLLRRFVAVAHDP